jgi:Dictyostelium (slime mold) repeat
LDEQRFDRLTRKLGTGTSRRQLIKVLAGGIVGGMVGVVGQEANAAAQDSDIPPSFLEIPGPSVSCRLNSECPSIGPCANSFCVGESLFADGQCHYYANTPGLMCRAPAGPCDQAEYCTATSASCPPDAFLSSGTVCQPAPGPCAGDAFCTGSSPFCPATPLLQTGTVCREAASDCDVAEVCTGTSAQCPDDAFAPAGTQCGSDGDVCNGQETCDGAGNCVPGSALICPEDNNPCTIAACDPAGGCIQVSVADNTTCNGTGTCVAGQCMACGRNEEVCNGQCRKKSSYNGDDRNCGACGRVCPDTHVCKGGFCRPL